MSSYAGMHTKTQDHPVQHPLAVNVVWIEASVLVRFCSRSSQAGGTTLALLLPRSWGFLR